MPKAKRKQSYMEKRFEDFGEELESLGKRFEKKDKGKYPFFGALGPLFSSVLGILFLLLFVWMLNFINAHIFNMFVYGLSAFLYENIGLFFIASLLFNYGDYFSSRYRYYCMISPVIGSFKLVFILWILTSLFIFVGDYTNVAFLSNVSMFIYMNLSGIFFLAVTVGLVVRLFCCVKNYKDCCPRCKK